MKLSQSRENLRQSSVAELNHALDEERKNLFMSRRDSITRQLENTKKIKQVRKNIARILTLKRERELGSAEAKR
jgi:large subunit ribosomal protein L29